MFRSLLSHVDVEGELESPTMSQGEPLPRPFRHHSQCLLYRGLSGDETHPVVPMLEVLSFWQHWLWISDCISRERIHFCAGSDRKLTVTSSLHPSSGAWNLHFRTLNRSKEDCSILNALCPTIHCTPVVQRAAQQQLKVLFLLKHNFSPGCSDVEVNSRVCQNTMTSLLGVVTGATRHFLYYNHQWC